MKHQFIPRAASRARWLAELSVALGDAQDLLSQLVAERIDQADADLLRKRVEELRTELSSLHRRGSRSKRRTDVPRPLHPDWQPRRD